MVQAVEAQLEKLQLKMKQFEEFETVMNLQRQQVDRDRVALYQTRLALNAKRANANSNAVPTISSIFRPARLLGWQCRSHIHKCTLLCHKWCDAAADKFFFLRGYVGVCWGCSGLSQLPLL